jgi:hypothetical protein
VIPQPSASRWKRIQTFPGLSIGIHNRDFYAAVNAWNKEPEAWSPDITVRAWINPASEPDVKFTKGEPLADEEEPPAEEPEA